MVTPSTLAVLPHGAIEVYAGHWICIMRLPLERGRVTHQYEVRTSEDQTCLARIQWYGPWRTYVLIPKDGSIWENRCLRDVVTFLEQLKQERRTSALWRKSRGET
mgnify:CR=1 FL=1